MMSERLSAHACTLVVSIAIGALVPVAASAQTNASSAPASPSAAAAPAPTTPRIPAPYNWSGVYFGGILGDGWAKADVTTTVTDTGGHFLPSSVAAIASEGAKTMHPNSAMYGGEAGYDFQAARVVFGGSFDFSVMTMNDFVISGTTYPCCAPSTFALTQTIETNWLMSARARVGWVSGSRLLIFGTAGIAWTDLKYQAQFSDNLNGATESAETDQVVHGWIYGGGVEYRLARNVSVQGEYLYSNFDPISVTSTNLKTNSGSLPSTVFTHTADFTLNVFKGSVKIRF
jgi:outer membrane immunogenic protein